MNKENVVLDKSFHFACDIVDFYKVLKNLKYNEIASQLIKCGTSIGANIAEAQQSQSKRDFEYKLRISLKEANECQYWLRLIDAKITEVDENLKKQNEEILKLLVSIIKSLNRND